MSARTARILAWFLVGFLGALVIGVLSYAISSKAARTAALGAEIPVRETSARLCDRSQVERAYLQLRAREQINGGVVKPGGISSTATGYFAIVNCPATWKRGNHRTVFLSRRLEQCYLNLVLHGDFGRYAERATTDVALLARDFDCTA